MDTLTSITHITDPNAGEWAYRRGLPRLFLRRTRTVRATRGRVRLKRTEISHSGFEYPKPSDKLTIIQD
eukprot:scaffold100035_cov54-Attheya_sp.AAC.1